LEQQKGIAIRGVGRIDRIPWSNLVFSVCVFRIYLLFNQGCCSNRFTWCISIILPTAWLLIS